MGMKQYGMREVMLGQSEQDIKFVLMGRIGNGWVMG